MNDGTVTILFNGPPGSGKDEACLYLKSKHPDDVVHHQFKNELFKETCLHYGVSMDFIDSHYDQINKNIPLPELGGLSPRQALIHVSEDIIKPKHGEDYFGVMAAKQIIEDKINVFSDSGFVEEARPVYDASDKLYVVQLYRDGKTFQNDSRYYIGNPKAWFGVGNREDFIHEPRSLITMDCIGFMNNGPLSEFHRFLDVVIKNV